MKKNIYIVLFGVLLSMGVISCDKDTDLLFNETAAQRKEGALKEYGDNLRSSEHGWLFQYFPEETQKYGGYNYVVKFNQHDSVSVWYEGMDDFTKPEISFYDMISYGGPVLTFNTYNPLMHKFANPSQTAYLGKGGDYEFLVISSEKDEIIVKGIKTGNTLRLTRMTEAAEVYLEKIKVISKLLHFAVLEGTVNGTKVNMTLNDHRIVFNYSEEGESKSVKAAFIPTQTGIEFYESFSILGVTVHNLNLDVATKKLTSDKGEVIIDIKPFDAANDFITGKRLNKGTRVYYSSLSYSPALENLVKELKIADPDFNLLQFYIDYKLSSGIVLTPQIDFYRGSKPSSGGRWIEYYYNFETRGLDKVLIEFLNKGDANYYPKAKPILDVFNGEFIVEPTSDGFILTSVKDPKYWVVVI